MEMEVANKYMLETCVDLFNKCGRVYSSIMLPVAFQLRIDGKQLTPVGAFDGSQIRPFTLGDLLYKEITYGEVAGWIVDSRFNLLSEEDTALEVIETDSGEVEAFVKTIQLGKPLQGDMTEEDLETSLCVCLDNSFNVTSKGTELYLGGGFEMAEVRLLFVPRNKVDKLPVEFNHFRLYKDSWLTLGKVQSPVVDIRFNELPTGGYTINLELVDEKLREHFLSDVRDIASYIINLTKGGI